MNKKMFDVLVTRANQYIIEGRTSDKVVAHLNDCLNSLDRLVIKENKKGKKLIYKKEYIVLAIYSSAVGDTLQDFNQELAGVKEFWNFAGQIGIDQPEITTISNIMLSRTNAKMLDSIECKIFQDVNKLALLGINTWSLLLNCDDYDEDLTHMFIGMRSKLNFDQSKKIFEADFNYLFFKVFDKYNDMKRRAKQEQAETQQKEVS